MKQANSVCVYYTGAVCAVRVVVSPLVADGGGEAGPFLLVDDEAHDGEDGEDYYDQEAHCHGGAFWS